MKLVEALCKFNRKERYWLIRHAIGNHHLRQKIRNDLAEVLRIDPIPVVAYWAIDYHLDWVAGAISELREGHSKEVFEQTLTDTALVQGNQEDIDLLIAFDNKIIMVEYKAGGKWGDQLGSKQARIDQLHSFAKSHAKTFNIEIRFAIVCPEKKKGDNTDWLVLDEYDDESFKRVERCDKDGKKKASGGFWRVKK